MLEVEPAGIEPAASCVAKRALSQLSYGPRATDCRQALQTGKASSAPSSGGSGSTITASFCSCQRQTMPPSSCGGSRRAGRAALLEQPAHRLSISRAWSRPPAQHRRVERARGARRCRVARNRVTAWRRPSTTARRRSMGTSRTPTTGSGGCSATTAATRARTPSRGRWRRRRLRALLRGRRRPGQRLDHLRVRARPPRRRLLVAV